MTTATFVKKLGDEWNGDARLYRLSEPIEYGYRWDDDDPPLPTTEYVIVSATITYSGPETYIFPANEEGNIVAWGEMDGSFRGSLDHDAAIANAGWKLA